ncbi:MAG: 3'-5' exonuclease [Pirellulaceae bacterium]|nr:3'-5' exonuclease [Pirellulaceae bacterium]
MSKPSVRYLVFDVESVADAALVARLRYPGAKIEPSEAVKQYRAELMKKYDSDFIPYTFQVPISIVVAKVASDFRLIDLIALDEPQFRSHVMTDNFWKGWDGYRKKGPLTLVSFNGRTFDAPLLELAAFRYGLPLPGWFNSNCKTYEQPRNRYNAEAHLDLQDVLTNFGASRFSGGLNLAANLLGKPGKMDVQGYMVQDLFNEGRIAEINDYCRCDVLDTYFVFLRCHVVLGQLKLEEEQEIIAETKAWLQERSAVTPVYASYLSRWGTWRNPWEAKVPAPTPVATEGVVAQETASTA